MTCPLPPASAVATFSISATRTLFTARLAASRI
jgi:hypothetical protein